MLACPDREQLCRYLADELDAAGALDLEAHVEGCAGCQEALDRLSKEAADAGGGIGSTTVPSPGFLQRLVGAPTRLPELMHPGPIADTQPVLPGTQPVGASYPQVAGYEVVGELGRGGMGVVYKAWQPGLRRFVALKMVLDPEFARPEELDRLRREAQTLARLDHPNIVRVYEVGTQNGRPFLSLEYVAGGRLDRLLGGVPQPARPAARLAAILARAVHAAHQGGIVHCDLKPHNILLARPVDQGGATQEREAMGATGLSRGDEPDGLDRVVPKVTDFGIAKRLARGSTPESFLVPTGHVIGTPAYMAPEQARGDPRSVGPAADVHALGAILYQILTGQAPFSGATAAEILQCVLTSEPVTPRRLVRVPRDLETICLKCLHKEPRRRYTSAHDLADDLERFLRGEPIQARPVGMLERGGKWVRRNPGLAGALLTTAVALLAGIGVSTFFAVKATREAREAVAARTRAEDAEGQEQRARTRSERLTAGLLLDKGLARAADGEVGPGLLLMLEAARTAPDGDPEGEALRRAALTNLAAWQGHTATLLGAFEARGAVHVAFRPDPDAKPPSSRPPLGFAVCDYDGKVHQYDWQGRPAGPTIDHHQGEPARIRAAVWARYAPSGRQLVTSESGTMRGATYAARLWDAADGRLLGEVRRTDVYLAEPAFSPDGRWLAIVYNEPGKPHVWQVELWPVPPRDGRAVHSLTHEGAYGSLTFSADGRALLSAGKTIRRLDTASGRLLDETALVGAGLPDARAFGPGGRLWAGDENGTVRLWDTQTGRLLGPPLAHRSRVFCLAFSPDGRMLAVGCEDRHVYLWEVTTGRLLDRLAPHRLGVGRVAFAPDGRTFLTMSGGYEWVSSGDAVRRWELPSALSRPCGRNLAAPAIDLVPPPETTTFSSVAYSQDRRLILGEFQVRPHRTWARVWDVAAARVLGPPVVHRHSHVKALALSPDGRLAVTSSFEGDRLPCLVHLWGPATGRLLSPPLPHTNWVLAAAVHRLPGGTGGYLLATGDYHGVVTLWELTPDGQDLVARKIAYRPQFAIVWRLAFSPDGKTLAVGTARSKDRLGQSIEPQVRIWEVKSGRPVGTASLAHDSHLTFLAFRPDGKALLTGEATGGRLWDLERGRPLGEPVLQLSGWVAGGFSPDGQTYLAGHGDGVARLWDAATGLARPGAVMSHQAAVTALAYSPDGRQAVIGCADGQARLWDLATFRPLGPPVAGRGKVIGVAFGPEGQTFLTTFADGTTRLWPVPRPAEASPSEVERSVEARTGWHLDSGHPVPLTDRDWAESRYFVSGAGGRAEATAIGSPDWHDARARDAEQDGDPHGAAWHLERLVRLRPADWLPRARLARALEAADRPAEADTARREAFARAPGEMVNWLRHEALAHVGAGQPARALRDLGRAIAAAPDDWRGHADRASLYGRLGKGGSGRLTWTACCRWAHRSRSWSARPKRTLAVATGQRRRPCTPP